MLRLALAAGLPLLLAAQQAPVPAVLARARDSVVLIHAQVGGGLLQQGSGVVLAPGLVATNAHVVRNARTILILKDGRVWAAQELCIASDRDLVLLKVPGLPLPAAVVAPPEPLRAGQEVVALGYPGGHGLQLSNGRIAAFWNYRGDRLIQADARTRRGSSGGGLFNLEGQLLGITTFVFAGNEGMNFSVPAGWILNLLERPLAPELQCPAVVQDNLLRDFSELIVEDPSNLRSWEALTRTWTQASPQDPEAWYAAGVALDRSLHSEYPEAGDLSCPNRPQAVSSALAAYSRAVQLDPGHARAWNNLGVAYDDQNRFPEAIAAFQRALATQPGYGLAWLNLGNTYVNSRNFQEAIAAYGKGLALAPDQAPAWARLAYCEGELKRWAEAAGHYRIALGLMPFRADWWAERVKACTLARDAAGAQAALERLEPLSAELARDLKAWARKKPLDRF